MRVLFDISVAGLAELHARHRTGVFRVVEGFLDELRRTPGVTITASAVDGAVARSLAARYLHGRALDDIRLAGSGAVHAALYPHYLALARSGNGIGVRAARRALRELLDAVARRYRPVTAADLDGVDVFHSPYHGFPELTRDHRLARVLTIHDLIPLRTPELGYDGGTFLRGVLSTLRPTDWLSCDSEATRNDVLAALPAHPVEQIRVVYPAVSERFAPASEVEVAAIRKKLGLPETPYFLSVGTLEKRKNIAHLVTAFAAFAKEAGPNAPRLFLVGAPGDGSESLAAQAARVAPGRVHFTGYVADADLAPLYGGSWGYVVPSLAEGFGLPLLEAMRCGTPVIASAAGSLPEVGGTAAVYVDARDVAALTAALHRLTDAGERKRLGAASLERARTFSWARTGEALRALYRAASASAS